MEIRTDFFNGTYIDSMSFQYKCTGESLRPENRGSSPIKARKQDGEKPRTVLLCPESLILLNPKCYLVNLTIHWTTQCPLKTPRLRKNFSPPRERPSVNSLQEVLTCSVTTTGWFRETLTVVTTCLSIGTTGWTTYLYVESSNHILLPLNSV